MNNETIGNFICELRKAKNLTQKQLADQLHITDKAVSKWERGMGYPDISMLSQLAETLGVTTNELLKGSREQADAPQPEAVLQNALQYAEKITITQSKKAQTITAYLLLICSFVAIAVCIICDLAISKRLTWSYYPLASIVFGCLVIVPLLQCKHRKIEVSLVSLSVFVIPFLFCVQAISNTGSWMLPIGMPIAAAAIVWLWLTVFLFKKLRNKWYAAGVALLLALCLNAAINTILSSAFGEPLFDVWDALSAALLAVLAAVAFATGYRKK